MFLMAFSLAMDACAVSVTAGMVLKRVNPGHILRMSLSFGFFQFLMPIIGWISGRTISKDILAFDHWIAFALLTFIGIRMLLEATDNNKKIRHGDPTRGWRLFTLSIATSIDALAAGLSLAFLNVDIILPCIIIGVITAILSAIGIILGKKISSRTTHGMEVLGGFILIALGVKILLQHTFH